MATDKHSKEGAVWGWWGVHISSARHDIDRSVNNIHHNKEYVTTFQGQLQSGRGNKPEAFCGHCAIVLKIHPKEPSI